MKLFWYKIWIIFWSKNHFLQLRGVFALALAIESVPSVNPLRPFKFPILVGVFTVFLLLVSYLRMPRREARLCWWALTRGRCWGRGGREGRCRGRCPPEETKICIKAFSETDIQLSLSTGRIECILVSLSILVWTSALMSFEYCDRPEPGAVHR